MNRLIRILFFVVPFVIGFFPAALAQKEVPELWGHRVHDDAKVLSAETVNRLEQTLKVFEDSTSNQVGILIIPSLDGEIIEEYTLRVAEKWKLGTEKKDNGVVMLIAINDRKMRIEVGQGLEGALTDALCNRIIRNEMAPNFRRGDYDAGVTAAVNAIMLATKGEYKGEDQVSQRGKAKPGAGFIFGLVILFVLGSFTYSALFTKGCAGWGLYGFLAPFYGIFPGLALGNSSAGLGILGTYLVAFPILKLILARTAWGQRVAQQMEESAKNNRNRGGGWSSGGGWFMGGGGSSWGGGGGGSSWGGGGGGFSGGGSSGSW
ncbi:MAG: TPM domain-containing protein [Cyclobacteriaceae bacterium]|nr:TPM domain-containing protein [Cyclobacteriaceae bacterium]